MRKLVGVLGLQAASSLAACAADGAQVDRGGSLSNDDSFYDPVACWKGFSDLGYDGPYCGWNDGYFYPGSGIYVYDRHRHPHIWSDRQKSHWSGMREHWHDDSTARARAALGMNGGSTVSRLLEPHEMGTGMRSLGGHFGGSRGGGMHGGGRRP
jgi:hypothetical protein